MSAFELRIQEKSQCMHTFKMKYKVTIYSVNCIKADSQMRWGAMWHSATCQLGRLQRPCHLDLPG